MHVFLVLIIVGIASLCAHLTRDGSPPVSMLLAACTAIVLALTTYGTGMAAIFFYAFGGGAVGAAVVGMALLAVASAAGTVYHSVFLVRVFRRSYQRK